MKETNKKERLKWTLMKTIGIKNKDQNKILTDQNIKKYMKKTRDQNRLKLIPDWPNMKRIENFGENGIFQFT